jgi:hypothetical protein
MARLEKIERNIERAQEKIAEWQTRLKELDGQRTEQENVEIVGAVRALNLTREELFAFIRGGTLPAARYSRKKQEAASQEDTANDFTAVFSTESEETNNEE